MSRAANGRWMRAYFHGAGDPLCVTYHRRINGKLRQLTVSPKLMQKVLR